MYNRITVLRIFIAKFYTFKLLLILWILLIIQFSSIYFQKLTLNLENTNSDMFFNFNNYVIKFITVKTISIESVEDRQNIVLHNSLDMSILPYNIVQFAKTKGKYVEIHENLKQIDNYVLSNLVLPFKFGDFISRIVCPIAILIDLIISQFKKTMFLEGLYYYLPKIDKKTPYMFCYVLTLLVVFSYLALFYEGLRILHTHKINNYLNVSQYPFFKHYILARYPSVWSIFITINTLYILAFLDSIYVSIFQSLLIFFNYILLINIHQVHILGFYKLPITYSSINNTLLRFLDSQKILQKIPLTLIFIN